jgi:hypothetical protein
MSTVRIQVRRGVSTGAGSWYSVNPTLAAGEIGLETDTGNFKFGDGSTAWNSLGYALEDSLEDYIPLSQKGVASGIASLDSSGFVPVAQLPPLAKVTVSSVANQAARLALTAEVGDIAIQADSGASYILQTTGASTDANWKELVGNEKVQDVIGAMLSGNTETGITVTYEDSDGTIDFVVADQFSTHSTSDLSEGTNLYYTTERAQDAVGEAVGTGLSYNDTTGAISVNTTTIQARVADVSDTEIGYLNGVTSAIQTQIDSKFPTANASTTNISEGTNLYFTEERAQDAIGNFLGSGLAYNDTTGAVSVDTANIQARVANVTDVEIGYLDGVTSAIQTQIDAKSPLTSPTFTGTVSAADLTLSGNLTVNGTTTTVNSTAINVNNQVIFEGATADAFETTLTTVEPTADRSVSLPDASGSIVLANNTETLSNKTINFNANTLTATLAQLNTAVSDADVASLAGTETLTNKTLTSPNINEAVALTATSTELNVLDGITSSTAELNILDGVTSSTAELNTLDGITATTAELNILDGVVASTAEINKLAGVTATSAEINILAGVTSTAAELNILDGATLSVTELNYVDGVTSAIQTQLNNKQATVANVSDAEIGYLDGVTSAIQTQIDAKAPLASPTFTGTVTLPSGTVTSGMILDGTIATADIADSAITSAKIADSAVTSAKIATGTIVNEDINSSAAIDWTKLAISSTVSAIEAGYLDGVTGPIQTQLDGKQATVANVSDIEIGYLDGVTSSIQTQLGNKQAVVANVSDVEIGYLYGVTSAIQTQINAKLASATAASTYAPLASPALTGTPTATLAVTGTNTTQIATTSFVQQELAVLTTGAPAALNTLDELAAALGDDANYAATITTALGLKAPLASPTFTGTVTLPAAGIVFTDGTQAKEGVPSRTPIIQKTAAYTLSALTERDSLIEVSSATGVTVTIPTNTAVAYPIGTSIDILQTGAGQVTIAPVDGTVTVNATPGLKLRTQWSSCTLFKRAANTWVVFGDLTA